MPLTNYNEVRDIRPADVVDFDCEHKVRRGVVVGKKPNSSTEILVLCDNQATFEVHWLTMRKVGTLRDVLGGIP